MADQSNPSPLDPSDPTPRTERVVTELSSPAGLNGEAVHRNGLPRPLEPAATADAFGRETVRLVVSACCAVAVALAAGLIGGLWTPAVYLAIVVFNVAYWMCGYLLADPPTLPEPRSAAHPVQQPDGTREVVETVVFVVVLVLLLKSFVAEAFVIPTGSMAQTLYGYQKEVTCPSCGFQFPVNCSSQVDPSDGVFSRVDGCTCPNCRQHIHLIDPNAPPRPTPPDSIDVKDPGWRSGDRVLVAKFVYDLFHRDPDRLDVVVFKFPGDRDFPRTGPQKGFVPMNYIKRLIGLPGETIAIHGGNLFILPPDKGPKYDDTRDPSLRPFLWQYPYMHVGQTDDLFRDKPELFQILRKKPAQILSMMRVVYDNDHQPKDMSGRPRWTGDEAWSAEGTGFRHAADGGGDTHWLRYRHLLREHEKPQLISDFMGYNAGEASSHPSSPGENWVNDLILEGEVNVTDPTGQVMFELAHGVDRFQARWDLATGECTLVRVRDGREEELGRAATALRGKGMHRVRLANVDRRLTVWVDRHLPFEDGVPYEAATARPTEGNDLERPASVGVRGGGVKVGHLKLFRDTYYTTGRGNPAQADAGHVDFGNPGDWDRLRDLPVATYYVQPGHFLCLGDNSPESSDGRSWGTVPERLLLGRALLVYYPFGRAGHIR